MAVAATKGRIRDIYEGLYVWIKQSLEDALYANYFVSMDYKFNIMNTVHDPIVTIRITPANYQDITYGRVWQGGGSPEYAMEVSYLFSIHVFSKYNTGYGEDHNRDAWIAARTILQYINTLTRATLSTKGIYAIDNMRMRESDPQGVKNMGRIIIDGEMRVIREDSP